jgi:putative FmdB family regulatory protein
VPTYQYACTACDEQLEVRQSFTDDPLTTCPRCEGRLRKIFNAVGVVFKGSGFYKTDSRKAESTAGTGASSGSSAESGSSTGASDGGSSSSGDGGTNKGDKGDKGGQGGKDTKDSSKGDGKGRSAA